MCIPGTYNYTTNSMDLVFSDGMVGYYDPLIRRCVSCPASIPKCRRIVKREYWVDCTNSLKDYSSFYAGLRAKMSPENIS